MHVCSATVWVQEGSEQLRIVIAAEERKQKDSSKGAEYSGRLEEYSKQAVSSRSTEEYKKSACEDLTCDLKTLCVL
jgi:hypothetical protein